MGGNNKSIELDEASRMDAARAILRTLKDPLHDKLEAAKALGLSEEQAWQALNEVMTEPIRSTDASNFGQTIADFKEKELAKLKGN